ncbi:MAG: sugar phosphate isomerase/epimerase family protein [candidate division FCPU426 bacterium]
MKIGVSASINTPDLAGLGFDYLEENVQDFLVPEQDAFVPRQSTPPLFAANCFLPGALKCVGPQVDRDRILRYATSAFKRAEDCGIRIIVFGSGGSRSLPEGFERGRAMEQFVSLLKELGPLAEARQLILAVEPIHAPECNFINTLAEGAEAVGTCGHRAVGLLCDFFHMARMGEGPEEVRKYASLLAHAHIAEKEKRTAPGVKGDDFRGYLKALKDSGYQGALSYECDWSAIADEAPKSLVALKKQINEAA